MLREHHEAITGARRKPGLLYTWRYRLEPPDAEVEGTVSTHNSRESRLRREVNKLKRLLPDKTVEVDFFRGALQKVEARRQQSGVSGEDGQPVDDPKSRTTASPGSRFRYTETERCSALACKLPFLGSWRLGSFARHTHIRPCEYGKNIAPTFVYVKAHML